MGLVNINLNGIGSGEGTVAERQSFGEMDGNYHTMNMLKDIDEEAVYSSNYYPDPLKGDASPGRPQTSKVYGSREVSFGASYTNSQVLDEGNMQSILAKNYHLENGV